MVVREEVIGVKRNRTKKKQTEGGDVMKIQIRDITEEEVQIIMDDTSIKMSETDLKKLNKEVGEYLSETCVDTWFQIIETGVKNIYESMKG